MLRLTSSPWFRAASIAFTPASLLLLTAPLTFAQATPGIVPYASYKFHQYDTISNVDLNRIITLPVRSKTGPIPFQANLVMNNNVGDMGYTPQVNYSFQLRIAGTGSSEYFAEGGIHCPPPLQNTITTHYHSFSFTDSTGAIHPYSGINFDSAACLNNENNDEVETSGTGLYANASQNPRRRTQWDRLC
jgi:hypothetical protein